MLAGLPWATEEHRPRHLAQAARLTSSAGA
jgi:hypothetical protein